MSDFVNITVDGKAVSVPKGTNLIEAAKLAGVAIPHYCYHPHLSVPGNCRMCQVEVVGAPKLMIGCHAQVQEGMQVKTQLTSEVVKTAQEATLEFILINHPLDCTVCDQSGHCKLQDYHYEYNGNPSRFLEEKVTKVKAEPLGPNVILDGERCIMCTRCIRFCDEVTGTSELGMLNRGDKSVIAINPGKELNNALSGTVVDLCPVGALTHRKWRFNTRIWYTKQVDAVCPGCSTGCNVKIATRDNKVVQVKARINPDVNKEWLCDEGRYGFERFYAENRVEGATYKNEPYDYERALRLLANQLTKETVVFLAPDLLLEDYVTIGKVLTTLGSNAKVVLAYRERKLSEVEAILVSPDYAANYKGALLSGLVSGDLEASFNQALSDLVAGKIRSAVFVGDRSLGFQNDPKVFFSVNSLDESTAIITDSENPLAKTAKLIIAGRSVLEKAGLLVNRKGYLQYSERALDFAKDSNPEWRIFNEAAKILGKLVLQAVSDRDATLEALKSLEKLNGLSIKTIKNKAQLVG